MSNNKTVLGGIEFFPVDPYANSDGTKSCILPPAPINGKPSFQPAIMEASSNSAGFPFLYDESNTVSFVR